MSDIKTFTFFESYYEAAQKLPAKDRRLFYEAIIEFAMSGKVLDLDGAAGAVFIAIKPVIEKSRKRSQNSIKKQNGVDQNELQNHNNQQTNQKRTINGTKTKRKQITDKQETNASLGKEKDKELDKDKELELKNTHARAREVSTSPPPSPPKGDGSEVSPSSPPTPFEKIKELYNTTCPSLPAIRDIQGKRRVAVKARWKEHPDLEYFRVLFAEAENCDFLKGCSSRGWKADFDWLMIAGNASKVLEGKYKNLTPPEAKGEQADEEFKLSLFK